MKNEPCEYCGENKWENREKHIAELVKSLQEKIIEDCQKIIAGVDFSEPL